MSRCDNMPSFHFDSVPSVPSCTGMQYEWPGSSVTTVRHPVVAQNRTGIMIGIVCVIMAFLYAMNAKAALKAPVAARAASAMLVRMVSGRTSKEAPTPPAGDDKKPKDPANVENVEDITEEDASKEISACSEPVLLFIWAHWCGHCHEAMPALSKAAAKLKSEYGIKTKAVNGAHCDPKFLEALNVTGFPTFLVCRPGGHHTQCTHHPSQLDAFTAEVRSDPQSFALFW